MTGSGQKRVDPFGWLIRVAWGRRLETGLTFVATAARVSLVGLLGAPVGNSVMALCALILVVYPPTQNWMVGLYRRERLERHYGKVFAAVGIDHGATPAVLAEWSTPSGAVLDLALSPRCTVKEIGRAHV